MLKIFYKKLKIKNYNEYFKFQNDSFKRKIKYYKNDD